MRCGSGFPGASRRHRPSTPGSPWRNAFGESPADVPDASQVPFQPSEWCPRRGSPHERAPRAQSAGIASPVSWSRQGSPEGGRVVRRGNSCRAAVTLGLCDARSGRAMKSRRAVFLPFRTSGVQGPADQDGQRGSASTESSGSRRIRSRSSSSSGGRGAPTECLIPPSSRSGPIGSASSSSPAGDARHLLLRPLPGRCEEAPPLPGPLPPLRPRGGEVLGWTHGLHAPPGRAGVRLGEETPDLPLGPPLRRSRQRCAYCARRGS